MTTDLDVSEPPVAPPLWTTSFRLFFSARVISLFGDAMLMVAIPVVVLQSGYGVGAVGYVFGGWMAAVALCTVFGGALSDRLGPRTTMVCADLARFVVQAVTAVLVFGGTAPLWSLVLLQVLGGAASALFAPGSGSIVPRLTTRLREANAFVKVAEAITAVVGPGLAGVLISIVGGGAVFLVDALTYLASAGCLLAMRLGPMAAAGPATSLVRDIIDGWHEFRSRSWLWPVILVWMVFGLVVFGPNLPVGAALIIGDHGDTGYGLSQAAAGAGAVIGGLVGMRSHPRRPLAAGALAMLAFVLCPVTLSFPTTVAVVSLGYLVAEGVLAYWSVMWVTALQTHVPESVRGRVFAYDIAGSLIVLSAGRILAGPAAAALGDRRLMALGGVVAVACCLALLAIPAVRRLPANAATPPDAGD
ncbi:MFS transporter [Dactylosporangium matsuzakiense]|uniref:MFS transporter n=1 Tax=Dactylosporangium matsuzakiense TaxID=53360 RepID=A0A9W6NMN0_9ACTN|nr:MFS transporter [Dactylosporangium matsuzakiense]GLL02142.1 MFS transporter [Dactylosporangium matsuzakiense]